jgi:hypothetical protein
MDMFSRHMWQLSQNKEKAFLFTIIAYLSPRLGTEHAVSCFLYCYATICDTEISLLSLCHLCHPHVYVIYEVWELHDSKDPLFWRNTLSLL